MNKQGIMAWAEGNPGAIRFLAELLSVPPHIDVQTVVKKITEATSLRGINLNVLYDNLCQRDMSKVLLLCATCPTPVLEDACSRQDYSGMALVLPYLEGKPKYKKGQAVWYHANFQRIDGIVSEVVNRPGGIFYRIGAGLVPEEQVASNE